jgi:hypothetical protein
VATGTLDEVIIHGQEEVNTLGTRACAKHRLDVIFSAQDAPCAVTNLSVLDGLTLVGTLIKLNSDTFTQNNKLITLYDT